MFSTYSTVDLEKQKFGVAIQHCPFSFWRRDERDEVSC
jgi:hypothetical protein